MDIVKYPYKINRLFILMGIGFFGWLTWFSYNQINNTRQWLVVGQSASVTAEQARYLLSATALIFALLTLMAFIILLNSFSERQNVIFTSDSINYPKGHVRPKVITIMYGDIRELERVNAQHNEALEITTGQGKYRILKSMLKNQQTFNEVCERLQQMAAPFITVV
ncbi:hypothetical protein LPW36_16170 [Jinshanibacter sp. LJY008]|uniref:Uncharacterized protein n=1 Tax=Limnobaculum eriocheiris TaxID=2897391 RepID=A0A9X1MZK0_9GAMM|nr:hypothetical protein [Limnobaculum eriocheiris]MCD1127510.1 hypothetical protein [Limnobaculum eriocheiris]